MRLFVAAITVVATFAVVVLLISRLFPSGAGWAAPYSLALQPKTVSLVSV
jgi:hypothetical protein